MKFGLVGLMLAIALHSPALAEDKTCEVVWRGGTYNFGVEEDWAFMEMDGGYAKATVTNQLSRAPIASNPGGNGDRGYVVPGDEIYLKYWRLTDDCKAWAYGYLPSNPDYKFWIEWGYLEIDDRTTLF